MFAQLAENESQHGFLSARGFVGPQLLERLISVQFFDSVSSRLILHLPAQITIFA